MCACNFALQLLTFCSHVIVIVDMSAAMNRTDYRPTRLKVVRNILVEFVEQFFDQNPISQLGIVTTQNSTARDLTPLASNPKHQIQVRLDSSQP